MGSRSLQRIHHGPYDQPTLFTWGKGAHSYRYDKAGELTEYVDAHTGHIIRERTFDGRERQFRYDMMVKSRRSMRPIP